jgi:hypothetical protein
MFTVIHHSQKFRLDLNMQSTLKYTRNSLLLTEFTKKLFEMKYSTFNVQLATL